MDKKQIEDEELTRSLQSSSILIEVTKMSGMIENGIKLGNALLGGATLLGTIILSFIAVKSGLVDTILGEADKISSGSPVNTYGVHVGYGKKLTFDEALKIVLKNEGGLANQKNDKGGLTNKGITQGTYDAWRASHGLKKQSVRNITEAEIRKIYHDNYWVASGADKENDPAMQIALFDSAVLYGVGKARQWHKQSGGDFDKFIQARRDYTDQIVAKDSSQQKFKKGWDNRTNRISDIGKQLQYEYQTKEEDRPTLANKTKAVAKGTSKSLINTAKKVYGNVKKSTGYCARAVHNILDKIGVGKYLRRRASAHDYIDELSKSPYFSEVSKSSVQVGDIVIYSKSAKHQYGHIFISDGGINSGISDFSGRQLKYPNEYGAIHVFRLNENNVKDVASKNEVVANTNVPKVVPNKNKTVSQTTQPKKVVTSNPKPNMITVGKEPMVARNS